MIREFRNVVCVGMISLQGASLSAELPNELWQELQYLDFRNTGAKIEAFQGNQDPGTPVWEEATLGLALCLHQRQPDTKGDKKRAAELYDQLLNEAKLPDIKACAALYAGRLAQRVDYFGDEADPEQAVSFYTRLIEENPDHSLAHIAALYRAQVKIFTMDTSSARDGVDELTQWIGDHPHPSYSAIQWMLIGKAWMRPLDDSGNALDAFQLALEVGLPPDTKLDALYWLMANLAEVSGRDEVAISFYSRLIEEVDRSSYGYDSQLRIRRLGGVAPELSNPFAAPEKASMEGDS